MVAMDGVGKGKGVIKGRGGGKGGGDKRERGWERRERRGQMGMR